MMHFNSPNRGFALIELLFVLGILAILFLVVITSLQPGKNFAVARNTARETGVFAISQAITQNKLENGNRFDCSVTLIASSTPIGSGEGQADICGCLVPDRLAYLPTDPIPAHYYNSCSDYSLGFTVKEVEGRVTVAAPDSELGRDIGMTY